MTTVPLSYACRVIQSTGPVASPGTLVMPRLSSPKAPCYCPHCRSNPPRSKLCEQLRDERIARMQMILQHKGPVIEEAPS